MEENINEFNLTPDTKLTTDLILQFKNKYKKIWKTTLSDGTEIVWRRLNRKEYKEIMKDYNDLETRGERLMEREDAVCRAAILYPCQEVMNEILNDMAGVSSVISDEIYDKSGFRIVTPEEL